MRGDLLGVVFIVLSLAMSIIGFSFAALKIEDQGDSLRVQYGPLPLFGKSIPYDSMVEVSAGQTSWIDGWGIHYIPTRGWTYNLWGWECVIVKLNNGTTVRLGTDDSAKLVEFLDNKLNDLTQLHGEASQEP